jgi:hypothetical protein
MSELDELVQRTVNTVTKIARRAARFSTKLLIGVSIVTVGGFLLGVAALSGGIETVWIVLGTVFGSIAIGNALLARWRVGSVKRHVPELASEVRTLISEDKNSTRTVIETFAVDPDGEGDDLSGGSAIVRSRQMSGFKGLAGSGSERSPRLTAAMKAITSFPLLALSAILISLVFGFLGFIFLIALAL